MLTSEVLAGDADGALLGALVSPSRRSSGPVLARKERRALVGAPVSCADGSEQLTHRIHTDM